MIGKYRALVFDVDGTLAETEELHRQSFNAAFAEMRLGWSWSVPEYRALLKTTGGKERISAYMDTLTWAGDPRAILPQGVTVPAIHARKTELYAAAVRSGGVQYKDGIVDLISFAHRNGLRLAIATTTSRANVDALLQANELWVPPPLFEVIACGDEVQRKKPHPDVFLLAIERLGVPADACLAIEDSWNGVTAACRAGLDVAAIPSPYSSGDDLSAAQLHCTHAGQLIAALLATPR